VIGCILDSTLGNAIGYTLRDLNNRDGSSMFTVQLNITYKKPVRTPGTIMARGWIVRTEDGGRKVWAKGVIEDEEGAVCALAEGMWLRPKAKEKL
jgi:acyl-coenzyme A thioesterase PaaI-like protein